MSATWGLACVVCLAFAIEASLGFGATLIAVSLGAFFVTIDQLLPAFVPVNLLLSGYLAARYFRDINGPFLLRRILPVMGLGLPVGMWAFRNLNPRWLKIGFGLFVAALSLVELLRIRSNRGQSPTQPTEPTQQLSRPRELVLLFLGGVIHGAFATGGPMAVYVAGREINEKAQFRSTLSMLWFLLNLVLIASYAWGGKLTRESGSLSTVFVGSLVVGLVAGEWAHRRVSLATFRVFVFGLLLIAGSILVARAV